MHAARQVVAEFSEAGLGGRRTSADDDTAAREQVPRRVQSGSKSPLHLVADDGSAHPLAHHDTSASRRRAVIENRMHAQQPGRTAVSGPERRREVGSRTQAAGSWEHVVSGATQAARRLRPLRRRPARMARPARVRIRSRNPWVFARRRLFGWNVRLVTTGGSHALLSIGDDVSRRRSADGSPGGECFRRFVDKATV